MNLNGMLPDNALKDKVIIVTGGGTGLGKSMSTYFSELGATVVIASRKQEVLDKSASEIHRQTGNPVLGLTCDVRNYDAIKQLIEEVVNKFDGIDILVNNAAGNFISPTERLSHRAFDAIIDIVLKGTFYMTHAVGKYWIKSKKPGTVLSITTTYAWTGSGYVVPSAMAKAGVLNMTRSLAVEWAKYNIRMNAIAPGPFPTPGAWKRLFPKGLEQLMDPKKRIPVGRFGEHKELANLAAYLVSGFSAFINGEVITIDGGEWLKGAGEFNDLEKVPNEMWDQFEQMIRSKKA
jgi:NAD(P)-dependent dehydrogenase (short-subunit alcohol dehydrogenase family)